MSTARNAAREPHGRSGRWPELVVFFVLAVLIWPFVAVAIVGGYGFLVWLTQMVLGPPGPPG